jgi:hypothetical protein
MTAGEDVYSSERYRLHHYSRCGVSLRNCNTIDHSNSFADSQVPATCVNTARHATPCMPRSRLKS